MARVYLATKSQLDALTTRVGTLETSGSGSSIDSSGSSIDTIDLSLDHDLVVATNVVRLLPRRDTTLVSMAWNWTIVPTGSAFKFTWTQGARLLDEFTLAAGVASGTLTLTNPRRIDNFADNNEPLALNITQVGSTVAGHGLALRFTTDTTVTPVEQGVTPTYVRMNDVGATNTDPAIWLPAPANTDFDYTFEVVNNQYALKVNAPPGGSPGNYFQKSLQLSYFPARANSYMKGRIDLTNKSTSFAGWFGPVLQVADTTIDSGAFKRLAITRSGANWVVTIGNGYNDGGPNFAPSPVATFNYNIFRFNWEIIGTTARARVWQDGTTEPGTWGSTWTINPVSGGAGIAGEMEPGSGSYVIDQVEVGTAT